MSTFDYEAYRQWYMLNHGRDPGTFTGTDLSQLAYNAWQSGDPNAYRQLIEPYLGQQLQTREMVYDNSAGEGGGSQSFIEYLDPVTGLWQRAAVNNDPLNPYAGEGSVPEGWDFGERTFNSYGPGAYQWKEGNETKTVNPYFDVEQRADGSWYIKDGGYGYRESDSFKDGLAGVAAVALGGLGLNYMLPGAPAGGAGGAAAGAGEGLAGAGWAEMGAAESAIGAGLSPAEVALGNAGIGGSGFLSNPGAGWAEMGAAESELGGMILDASPVGAGVGGAAGAAGSAAGSGAATGAGTAASAAASSIPDWLKVAAPLLGAAAGSQGQQQTQTTRQEMTPELKPFIFGSGSNPGLMGHTQNVLNMQMQPGWLDGYGDMRTIGRQMMATPLVGNGFNRFFPGV